MNDRTIEIELRVEDERETIIKESAMCSPKISHPLQIANRMVKFY